MKTLSPHADRMCTHTLSPHAVCHNTPLPSRARFNTLATAVASMLKPNPRGGGQGTCSTLQFSNSRCSGSLFPSSGAQNGVEHFMSLMFRLPPLSRPTVVMHKSWDLRDRIWHALHHVLKLQSHEQFGKLILHRRRTHAAAHDFNLQAKLPRR